MCGIVGAVAERDVAIILVEGLKRLEYRGYDSAGILVLDANHQAQRHRVLGKVSKLAEELADQVLPGHIGIAHTRWATHGEPSQSNAHPHMSNDTLAVVHNGIIENYETLRETLKQRGYHFESQTDSEVIAHLIYDKWLASKDLLKAVQSACADLVGAYAIAVLDRREPDKIVVARQGSPLVIGVGIGEHFIGSDQLALLPVTQQFIFLEEGDIAAVTRRKVHIIDAKGQVVKRAIHQADFSVDAVEKGEFRHYMQKEIAEQPQAIANTLSGRVTGERVLEAAFGPHASAVFDKIEAVQIVACGTSYHAGMIARYWFEELANLPCQVEIASEIRYRKTIVRPNTLFVVISQSGETADTLAALRQAKTLGYLATLVICNVPSSSMVREADLNLMTRAGTEIGVASTKAFTTQLVALLLLVVALGRRHGLSSTLEASIVAELNSLPQQLQQVLNLDQAIHNMAELFVDKQHCLFLGRGAQYPVALEGALKLKEISYIHAEAYPAGELKHGPLALVDEEMPVIAVAPSNELLEKLKSNLEEVRARGGKLYVFAGDDAHLSSRENVQVFSIHARGQVVTPIIYTIPLQLLAYHVAVLKGTDVDQPRNLAKSVTVE